MIKITAVSYNNQTSLEPLSAVFGRQSETLGRGSANHLVLPDPKHLVSRIHASIKSEGGRHMIVNLSKTSPILLNGHEITTGDEYPLKSGDELQIGLYVLRAEPHLVAVEDRRQSEADVELQLREHAMAEQAQQLGSRVVATQGGVPNPPQDGATVPLISAMPVAAVQTSVPNKPAPHAASDDVPPAPANTVDSQALIAAFLAGAGIPHVTLTTGLTPEFMEMMGKLLATSIEGTFELIGSRALIKREVNADVTMVVVRNNNPLKFLSDSQTVLTQMLRKKMPGFMGPVEAMQDAYADLRAHQGAMLAGMHGVVDDVLQRLDPKEIERHTKGPSFIDALAPAQRKARMWNQYRDLHKETRRGARSEFQALFGEAFLKAYDGEVDRAQHENQDD